MNNIFEKGKVMSLVDLVDYSEGGVVSKQILKSEPGNITLFSFDEGQGLSEHAAPFDAMVQVLDGCVEIKIAGKPSLVKKGETIILPANIPHALQAVERFKMLLTMIRG